VGGAIGLIGCEIDFAEESGLVMFEFANHGCG
jgi:hypothetical protein